MPTKCDSLNWLLNGWTSFNVQISLIQFDASSDELFFFFIFSFLFLIILSTATPGTIQEKLWYFYWDFWFWFCNKPIINPYFSVIQCRRSVSVYVCVIDRMACTMYRNHRASVMGAKTPRGTSRRIIAYSFFILCFFSFFFLLFFSSSLCYEFMKWTPNKKPF